mmetsp:Transcript_3906/g.11064  ORF Transcript_3906/g.11064 Transcript_3906/m.11064 type:complete len:743 (+) Transcript_3906:417-2645(+)|eukprot:CAMPEP_0117665526 /NCGR_PEP_ID=MMETSP0804-20121206/9861_1 /TAXON_ID=1074897 /ORGANISM="Tetraselmis astigmatica, Strain CCMP880" /LENGTH=742 /DNA_ID=CAMNT_0005472953 /DNA_START=408 /DNA_END=2636 /DNA_ORIENTATION=+
MIDPSIVAVKAADKSRKGGGGQSLSDMASEVVDALGAAITGNGTTRSKRLGRTILGLVMFANLLIFYNNIRNLMADEGEIEPPAFRPTRDDIRRAANHFAGSAQVTAHRARQAAPPITEPVPSRTVPPNLWATGEFAAARQRRMPEKVGRQLPVLASVLTSEEEMVMIRRFVGSVHHWQPEMQIVVYVAAELPEERLSEVNSWKNVTVVPVEQVLRELTQDFDLRSLSQGQGVLGQLAAGAGSWEAAADESLREPGVGDAALREAMQQVTEWQPVVLYHAVHKHSAAIYMEPWGVLVGWIDHILKALLRDGTLFVCQRQRQTGAQHAQTGIIGYSKKSAALKDRLSHQVACALGSPCAEQPIEQEGAAESGGHEQGSNSYGGGLAVGVWEVGSELCHPVSETNIEMGFRSAEGGTADPDALGGSEDSSSGFGGASNDLVQQLTARYACKVQTKGDRNLAGELRYATEPSGGETPLDAAHVALGIPTTTRGTQLMSPDELPVFNAMLASLLDSIQQQPMVKYRYTLLLGFEVGDKVLDNPAKLERLYLRLVDRVANTPVSVRILRFPATGSTTALWNALFFAAANNGADYFMACHDDTEFTAPGRMGGGHTRLWSDALVGTLQANPMQANFGVVAPTDRRNTQAVTHPMVHIATHRAIFGSMFPNNLGNQEHEEWISRVYGARSTFLLSSVGVYNGHRFSGRARGCRQGKDAIDFAVEDGALLVKAWAEKQLDSYTAASGRIL